MKSLLEDFIFRHFARNSVGSSDRQAPTELSRVRTALSQQPVLFIFSHLLICYTLNYSLGSLLDD